MRWRPALDLKHEEIISASDSQISSLTCLELVSQALLNLGLLLSLLQLLRGLGGPLLVEDSLLSVGQLGSLLPTQGQSIVGLVPDKVEEIFKLGKFSLF